MSAAEWEPRVLSILRFVVGLMFVEHGLAKLFGFPIAAAVAVVRSTKRCDGRGALIEELPCGLSMPLAVFERGGVLHFLSSSYYFRCLGLKLTVPAALPPGRTHVEHIDEGGGWFRFTMSVSHPWLGEVYFQTGRFRAASEAS